jgi:hypothetical protein
MFQRLAFLDMVQIFRLNEAQYFSLHWRISAAHANIHTVELLTVVLIPPNMLKLKSVNHN